MTLGSNFPVNNVDVQSKSGFHFIMHPTDAFPSETSYHFYNSMNSFEVLVTPELFLVSDELKSLDLERRNCYFEEEKQLVMFKFYSKANCEHECQSFLYSQQCGCVPFYLLSISRVSRNSLHSFTHLSLQDVPTMKPAQLKSKHALTHS